MCDFVVRSFSGYGGETIVGKVIKIIYLIFGLILSVLILYGLYVLIKNIFMIFMSLQTEVTVAITAAMSTIIVSVLSVTIGKYYERKRIIEQELREKKIPMYEEFIGFYFNILMSETVGNKKMSDEDMVKFFNVFTQRLMVWGSDEVVRIWSSYRSNYAPQASENPQKSMFEFERLLLAIRKDTGHKNKGFEKGDLLGLFINDID